MTKDCKDSLNVKKSPVLLILFNRPETTKKVFEAIRKAKPKKLYVSGDGPRQGNKSDVVNCEKARMITKQIDWDCDVKYRFLDENLGCGWGPASAISWAFETEDSLIILEDDCVPSQPFFPYCNYLLNKFKDNERIWLISGRSHHSDSKYFKKYDYIYTRYGHSWGWATWKRCWNHFDMEMSEFPEFLKEGGGKNVFFTKKEGRLYNRKYNKLFSDKELFTHVWDYQFGFSLILNNAFCIVPRKNLIENVGWNGTHNRYKTISHTLQAYTEFELINEPKFVVLNREYELFHFKRHMRMVWGVTPIYRKIFNRIIRYIQGVHSA
jgi:hypothetical protein